MDKKYTICINQRAGEPTINLWVLLKQFGADDSSLMEADLMEAEAEIATCLQHSDAAPDGETREAFAIRADNLDRFIATMPPRSLTGAAVKLRRLLDPGTGIAVGTGPADVTALAQVLGLLQAIVGRPRHRTRPAATLHNS
jgi:hypothetical protein